MDSSTYLQPMTALFAYWYDVKMMIERIESVSADAMHVIVGVLLQLLFAVVLRRPLGNWLPWSAVLAVLVFNETVDLWVERWPSLAAQIGEGIRDLLLTMLLPTALLLAFRWSPTLGQARRR